MPRTKSKGISSLPAADLVYAIELLVAAGKTSVGEVLELAAHRGVRIARPETARRDVRRRESIATMLVQEAVPAVSTPAALSPGESVAVSHPRPADRSASEPALPLAPKPPAQSISRPPTTPIAKPLPRRDRNVVRFALGPTALRTVRTLQGRYVGLLRNFTGPARDRIKGIVKMKSYPAAIAAMERLLAAEHLHARQASEAATGPSPDGPRKYRIGAQRAAQLRLQGRYIGLLRGFAEPEKTEFKAVARGCGMRAAIEAMLRMPGRTWRRRPRCAAAVEPAGAVATGLRP